jgi:hypothetical protein
MKTRWMFGLVWVGCWFTFFSFTRECPFPDWLSHLQLLLGPPAVLFTAQIFASESSSKKSLRALSASSSEQRTHWIYSVLGLAWLIIFLIVVILLPRGWHQLFSLLNIWGLYLIWRLWPDPESEARAENASPGTGADSET